jgi:hypothetical protein
MNSQQVLSIFELPVSPPGFGICGFDEQGTLYFHPGLISEDCALKAYAGRDALFIRLENTLVGLVSFAWARNKSGESESNLELLEKFLRRFIATGDRAPRVCHPVAVSFPGEPAFIDALLKTIGGSQN